MSSSQSEVSSTLSKPVYDLEGQPAQSPKLQRKRQTTLDAIGDKTALIIESGKDKMTLTCDRLHVEYELSYTKSKWRTQTLTRFTRRDKKDPQDVLIAEWELNTFTSDRLRLESSDSSKDFFPAKSYLTRDGWFKRYLSFNQRFEVNGRGFIWRSSLLTGDGAMVLFAEGNDDRMAITHCAHYFIKPRFGFIEISHDEAILDELVVTWALVRQRRAERAAWFNIIHTLLFDCLMMTLLEVFVWH